MNDADHRAPAPRHRILVLCTGNSARSIIAEALFNHLGAGRVRAWSAGSHPTGRVNPHALRIIEHLAPLPEAPRSKSWDEFAHADAPRFDFIFTVCDNAAGEVCPLWPGQALTAHWGIADPAAVTGSETDIQRAFEQASAQLQRRIEQFLSLPLDALDSSTLQHHLNQIGTQP